MQPVWATAGYNHTALWGALGVLAGCNHTALWGALLPFHQSLLLVWAMAGCSQTTLQVRGVLEAHWARLTIIRAAMGGSLPLMQVLPISPSAMEEPCPPFCPPAPHGEGPQQQPLVAGSPIRPAHNLWLASRGTHLLPLAVLSPEHMMMMMICPL